MKFAIVWSITPGDEDLVGALLKAWWQNK